MRRLWTSSIPASTAASPMAVLEQRRQRGEERDDKKAVRRAREGAVVVVVGGQRSWDLGGVQEEQSRVVLLLVGTDFNKNNRGIEILASGIFRHWFSSPSIVDFHFISFENPPTHIDRLSCIVVACSYEKVFFFWVSAGTTHVIHRRWWFGVQREKKKRGRVWKDME